MLRKSAKIPVLLPIAFLLATMAAAQTNTGILVGTATDDTGAAIPNANVTVKSLGTGEQRTLKTDSSGEFTVPNLQVGHCSITAA